VPGFSVGQAFLDQPSTDRRRFLINYGTLRFTMHAFPSTAIFLLAAGAGRRMGRVKQLLPWGGKTLLTHVLSEVLKLGQPTYLILGAHADEIKQQLPDGDYQVVVNNHWEEGMGTSIAAGIAALGTERSPEQIMVCLGDQPFVTEDYLLRLMKADKDLIRATAYGERAGVPAVFPVRYRTVLAELRGDAGARKLLRGERDILRFHADAAVIDLDTPEDYQRYEGDS
jgi:molybdenum cofactor cytidylyltransferase